MEKESLGPGRTYKNSKSSVPVNEVASGARQYPQSVRIQQFGGTGKTIRPTTSRKVNSKLFFIITCAVVSVVAGMIIGVNGGGYEKVVSQYYKALETKNVDLYYSIMMPKEILNAMGENELHVKSKIKDLNKCT